MKIDVLDTKGKKIETLALEKSVFDVIPNLEVISQYLRVFKSNQRQGTSSTKNRGEVSGSGRKPWKQKGTGRARVGSARTPLWRHGGIVHGPRPRSWVLSLPTNLKRLALVSALSKKLTENKILVVDTLHTPNSKTVEFLDVLKALDVRPYRTLIILETNDMNVRKSAQNIKGVETALAHNLNTYQLLLAQKIIFIKDALLQIQDKYKRDK